MKIIKLGIISIIVFALLITGMSLFFPSRIRISKATDVKADKAVLSSLIKDTANWKKWYPGADSVKLNVTITTATDSLIVAVSNVSGGRRAVSGWNIYEAGMPGMITVQWYMDFKLGWLPWEKFSGLLLEKRYGPVMEKGLENMKKVLVAP
jgi:hypothetical protein